MMQTDKDGKHSDRSELHKSHPTNSPIADERQRTREREVDNFLVEELTASESFRDWFLRHVDQAFEAPEYTCVVVSRSPARLVASGQTDVGVKFLLGEQTVAELLIESKVADGFQDTQPERYKQEVEALRARYGTKQAAAVVVSPASNAAVLDHHCFDATVRLEQIADYLRQRLDEIATDVAPFAEELAARIGVKIRLIDKWTGNHNHHWSPAVMKKDLRDFHSRYDELAQQSVRGFEPSDVIKTGATKKPPMRLFYPQTPELGRIRVRHQFGRPNSAAKLECGKSDPIRLRQFQASGLLPRGAVAELTKTDTLMVGMNTPNFSPVIASLTAKRKEINESFRIINLLVRWCEENAPALSAYMDRRGK